MRISNLHDESLRKVTSNLEHRNSHEILHGFKDALSKSHTVISNFHHICDFSSSLKDQSVETCVSSLIRHRFVKKYNDTRVSGEKTKLQSVAFTNYIDYENNHCSVHTLNLWGSSPSHLRIRKVRSALNKWLRNVKLNLYSSYVEFTPGETYLTTYGNVSVAAKLSSKSHWTVSYNCLDDACALVYNNAGLKRAARYLIAQIPDVSVERRSLYRSFSHAGSNIGYRVFSQLLKNHIFTVVDGARGSSVPKNNETDRFINVEPLFNMILQRIIAGELREVLHFRGNSLDNQINGDSEISAQDVHKVMIADNSFATIDFSNASDSVILQVVQQLVPTSFFDLIMRTRSHYVTLGDDIISPSKVSSMGNGFTFELMTTILYCLATIHTPFCRVYGDDVIVPNTCAESFMDDCKLLGFTPNYTKTFVNSVFRESCGAFYHDEIGYITSFDIKEPTCLRDCVIICNKLHIIITSNAKFLDALLFEELSRLHQELLKLIPVLQKGPVPCERLQLQMLAVYCYDPKYLKKHKQCTTSRLIRDVVVKHQGTFLADAEYENFCVIVIPYFKNKEYKPNSKIKYLTSLLQGRRTKQLFRSKGHWHLMCQVVLPNGSLVWFDGHQQ